MYVIFITVLMWLLSVGVLTQALDETLVGCCLSWLFACMMTHPPCRLPQHSHRKLAAADDCVPGSLLQQPPSPRHPARCTAITQQLLPCATMLHGAGPSQAAPAAWGMPWHPCPPPPPPSCLLQIRPRHHSFSSDTAILVAIALLFALPVLRNAPPDIPAASLLLDVGEWSTQWQGPPKGQAGKGGHPMCVQAPHVCAAACLRWAVRTCRMLALPCAVDAGSVQASPTPCPGLTPCAWLHRHCAFARLSALPPPLSLCPAARRRILLVHGRGVHRNAAAHCP
jgi:hypothetical protein